MMIDVDEDAMDAAVTGIQKVINRLIDQAQLDEAKALIDSVDVLLAAWRGERYRRLTIVRGGKTTAE